MVDRGFFNGQLKCKVAKGQYNADINYSIKANGTNNFTHNIYSITKKFKNFFNPLTR